MLVAGCGGSHKQKASAAPNPVTPTSSPPETLVEPTTTVPPPQPVAVAPGQIATAGVPKVDLFDAPDAPAPAQTMANPTSLDVPLVFLVREQLGDWLHVQVPARPNEHLAWVRSGDVKITQTTFRIHIELGAHHLAAFDGDNPAPVFEAQVAIGTASTPTPTGHFYIDAAYRLANPNGPYGAYALSVAGFSNVLTSFSGGPGQIAIHGTNRPNLIGTPASHGCVRMTNAEITKLVNIVPVGTPVDIVA